MKVIGYVRTDFPEKFGVPRQSSLAPELSGKIVFEEEYRNADAVRGLEAYDYLWLIWEFSKAKRETWSPTVRPPKLGGNKRVGVFATRSPFRPNAIGLSSVRLEKVDVNTPEGPVIYVSGIDMMDGTPIYDIKPYLPFVDSHPEARGGFADEKKDELLEVDFPEAYLDALPEEKREGAKKMLAMDPRPAYQKDETKEYGVKFAGFNIRFQVQENRLLVTGIEED